MDLTLSYPHSMSQALPHPARQSMARLARIGLRAASDQTGSRTFRALLREVPKTPVAPPSEAANRVTQAMTPPQR